MKIIAALVVIAIILALVAFVAVAHQIAEFIDEQAEKGMDEFDHWEPGEIE